MERQINSGCGNCWFCYNGQCNYHGKCDYAKKWSNILQNYVPTTYIEPKTNSNDYSVLK